jgi:hypothetical protein
MSKKHDPDWDEPATSDPKPEASEATERVKCISDLRPSIGDRCLANGEEADVPVTIAKALREKGFVE